jgi:hypothetical protein
VPNSHSIPPIEDSLSQPIPRIGQQRDRRPPLTNREGLVLVRKSTLLSKLGNEWRHLLNSSQIQNLCFFFECPVSHQDYSEANNNDCLNNLGPLSLSCWKFISEIHVLFPSHVGHICVAKRANLPHYQEEVFSKFVLAYEDTMPVYLYMCGKDYSNHFMLV